MILKKQTPIFVIAVFFLLIQCMAAAENIDPNDSDSQYLYAENAGWLNAEPLGIDGPGVVVDDVVLAGYIWAENIGWISLSCENTESCDTVNYGIVNDGLGHLSGYAWSENAGWINFSCETNDSCGNVDFSVTIDTITGRFAGYAWGENIGWIRFDYNDFTEYHAMTSWRIDGDVSSNGLISLEDVIMTLQVGAGSNPASQIYVGADVNDDDRIGLEEGIYVLKEVAVSE